MNMFNISPKAHKKNGQFFFRSILKQHIFQIYFSTFTASPINLWIATALLSHKEFACEIVTFSLMYKALNWITIITVYDMLSADMAAAFVEDPDPSSSTQ